MAKKSKKSRIERTKKKDILLRARPVQEIEEYSTSLFYGRSGTGKTTLASTYPKDIILLEFKERGTDSISDIEGIDILQMENWLDVEDAYWALQLDEDRYQTVVLDTVSGMQTMCINKVREDNNLESTDTLSRRAWGEVAGLMNTWLLNYRDLPMHIVFLAADRIKNNTEDDDDSTPDVDRLEPEVGPALIPSVARSLNASVKVIGNTFIRQRHKIKEGKPIEIINYVLRIGPHPYYITKIRSPKKFKIPNMVINPSFAKIIKIIKGENND